ncbi:EthD family reductase [Planococcus lenghuensis]|uniref:EthD domain-containing protein n=1 Tax=Planococcus lenghuensis TaxID=2213202 RepID=A0A1Q2L361_9BACL|nr:EthD family reductase [Planococcus lenghuensis]AQQ54871.1 hypothetical protein B0X71_18365 [Planococcus lenghuensis]
MAKFIVLYEEPNDKDGFEKHYMDVHIPLVNELPDIKRTSLDRVVNADNAKSAFYLHVEIEYEDLATLNASLSSPAGQKVKEDAVNLAPFLQAPPQILITD